MASPKKVIVFGPTGAVGSSAARTASKLGATVALAMRDTSKPIPGLSRADEDQGNFTRVTADLTKPDTVRDAVQSTSSKVAFIYLAHGNTDGMEATITALKTAGIELVVFLSSFTIRGELESIPPSESIPYWHAQVEISLTKVFGPEGYVAIRPGCFASNNLQYKAGVLAGEVAALAPEIATDNIVPEDIGRVSGTVLAKGVPEDGTRAIYLYGPELLTQAEALRVIGRVLGKDVKVSAESEEDTCKRQEAAGFPRAVGDYMIRQTKKVIPDGLSVMGYSVGEAELKNVEKYSGHKGTTFEEYVRANKAIYAS